MMILGIEQQYLGGTTNNTVNKTESKVLLITLLHLQGTNLEERMLLINGLLILVMH